VIQGFTDSGVLIFSANNTIAGNYIGTNATGTAAVANGDIGVRVDLGASNNVIGGPNPADRNLISGNTNNGVVLSGTGTQFNAVFGNYIGTNAAGTAALGGQNVGVFAEASASNNFIGGVEPGLGNVIGGNAVAGVELTTGSGAPSNFNFVDGNLIGLRADGAGALANGTGVLVHFGSGDNFIRNNVISGNTGAGVALDGANTNQLLGNVI